MLKKLAWNTFKNTGNIDTFIELIEVSNAEKEIKENFKSEVGNIEYGNNQDEGNCDFRK